MVTAVFYTYGMEGVPRPDPSLTPRALPTAAFGTGLGGRKQTSLEFIKGRRGLMLAAMTFYYRSAEQIAQLIRGEASPRDPLARVQPVSLTVEAPPSDSGTPTPPPSADETPPPMSDETPPPSTDETPPPSTDETSRPQKDGAEEYELEP
jgi:hypothetical protein